MSPSSGHYGEPIALIDVNYINDCIENAVMEGLECEWWGTFLEGIRKGLTPQDAARGASEEWDL